MRLLPKTTIRPPQSLARVRQGHPLARGLIAAFTPVTGNVSRVGSSTITTGVDGAGFTAPTTSAYWQGPATSQCVSTNAAWTFLAIVNGSESKTSAIYAERPSANQIVKLEIDTGGKNPTFTIRDSGGVGLIQMGQAVGGTQNVVNGRCVFVCQRVGPTNHRLYIDGVFNNNNVATTVPFTFSDCAGNIGFDPQDTTKNLALSSVPLVLLWNRALTDQEVAQVSLNPWAVFRNTDRYPLFVSTAASGTSYIITPSGGVTFSGTALEIRGRVQVPSGGVVFSGTAPNIRTRVQKPTGSVLFSGTAPITFTGGSVTYTITPSGGFVLSGAAPEIRGRVQKPTGTFLLSGTAIEVRGRVQVPSGGITFSGSTAEIRTRVQVPTGSVVFSGSAPITFTGGGGGGFVAKYRTLMFVGQ